MNSLEEYRFVPMSWVAQPPKKGGSVTIIADSYWCTRGGDELSFFHQRAYGPSPQCNINEGIVRRLMVNKPWAVQIVFVPWVFLPTRHFDVVIEGECQGGDFEYVLPTEDPHA